MIMVYNSYANSRDDVDDDVFTPAVLEGNACLSSSHYFQMSSLQSPKHGGRLQVAQENV